MNTPGPRPRPDASAAPRPPGWKVLLAMASLAICLLLWVNGLLTSLERPSVAQSLERRQKELAVLATPVVPSRLRAPLLGEDPERELLAALSGALDPAPAIQEPDEPVEPGPSSTPALELQRALLEQRQGEPEQARRHLQRLGQIQPPLNSAQQELVQALLERNGAPPNSAPPPAAEQQRLLAASSDPLVRRWACEALGSAAETCRDPGSERQALAQLLAVNGVPLLAVLAGIALLLRQLWLRWRGQAAAPAPLLAPRLSLLDLTLLVAGGFVVIGEVLTPVLLAPLLERLLTSLGADPVVRQGGLVLGLYLGLMSGPLLILAWMLAGQGSAPEGGWLQYRWRPWAANLRRALSTLLMVLPVVSLVSWAGEQLWGDPGGSNPLLDLVLNSRNPLALGCFAVTALVLAPLFEETIFRGVLLPVVSRSAGPLWGVLISSAVFGVAHLSLGELPPLFVLGLGLGWLRLQSGRLGASVLMHGLWNGLTFLNLVLLGH